MPKDFPRWKAVHSFYSRMKEKGVWSEMLADLVEKNKGRKYHIVTDTFGHLPHVRVHAANEHDTVAECGVFEAALNKYPSLQGSLQGICADVGYCQTSLFGASEYEFRSISYRLPALMGNYQHVINYF